MLRKRRLFKTSLLILKREMNDISALLQLQSTRFIELDTMAFVQAILLYNIRHKKKKLKKNSYINRSVIVIILVKSA